MNLRIDLEKKQYSDIIRTPFTRNTNAQLKINKAFKFNDGQKIAYKLIRYMREREKYRARWVGALEQMTQPFRFINGLEDRVSGAHLVKRFREVLPHQTDIIELADIGHFPHFEVPEIVLEKFLEFHQSNSNDLY